MIAKTPSLVRSPIGYQMAVGDTGIKLITVSFDDDRGLDVDWEGSSPYEAWGMLKWAVKTIEAELNGEPYDEDD